MLHKNHVLQDEIAMLRLEIDTIKNQKQKVEKNIWGTLQLCKKRMTIFERP